MRTFKTLGALVAVLTLSALSVTPAGAGDLMEVVNGVCRGNVYRENRESVLPIQNDDHLQTVNDRVSERLLLEAGAEPKKTRRLP